MWRKGNPPALLVGMWTGAATLENCVEVPQTVKNRPALRPSNCTAGDLPQRYRCSETAGHLHPDVSSGNVPNSQTVEGASVPIERWMDKEDVVSVYNGILAIRNNKYGILGWRSGLAPAFGPGRDPGDPESNPTSGSRCMEPASPSACVSASLSLSVWLS